MRVIKNNLLIRVMPYLRESLVFGLMSWAGKQPDWYPISINEQALLRASFTTIRWVTPCILVAHRAFGEATHNRRRKNCLVAERAANSRFLGRTDTSATATHLATGIPVRPV
jgi:hypothetical protein